MANKEPISKTFLPLTNATAIIGRWEGNNSVQLQVDQRLRERPLPSDGQSADEQDKYAKLLKKVEAFQTYGCLDFYESDVPNLFFMLKALLPPTARLTLEL